MNGDKEIIEHTYIEDELKDSYLDYAMSVIVGRALPDVRDGLKPVHRRILYAMNEVGLTHEKAYKKSAAVVGEVLGKYHPHGDSAVYDSIVRMVQTFSLRYPLIDGQGNFGSVDGDSAAAYRYTEVKLKKLSSELLSDIDRETVDFIPNFDGSHNEPLVLPAKLPNLLLNGSAGIAVGMATNIPPHNLGELVDAITLIIDNPSTTIDDILKVMPGPDFPTGGIIFGRDGIREAYTTGRGKLQLGAVAGVEELDGREAIIVTELPYQVNKAQLLIKIADLVRAKKIEGISDIRDESDRDGMRMVIELKRDAMPQQILNLLQKHTQMLDTFGIIMLALVNNKPMVMGIREIIDHYINHRKVVIKRRSEFLLKKAEADAHIKEGLLKAIANIDEIIALIRKSKNREDAHEKLIKKFSFSDAQTKAILDLRLHRLTSLERIEEERALADLLKEIERLKFILANEREILSIIKNEISELKKEFGDERRTKIVDMNVTDFKPEDLIKDEDVVITISHAGYIKRLPLTGYRAQKRGGRGVNGMETKEEDFVEHILTASTHNFILFFTEKGTCHWLKVYDIPQVGRAAKGKAIVNLIQLASGDKITAFVPVDKFDDDRYIFMATRNGVVKKSALSAYSNPRASGIIALTLEEGDSLIEARLTDGTSDIVLGTKKGMAIRFSETKVRPMGRTATGVYGIRLEDGDVVVGMVVMRPGTSVLSVCMNGYGKQTPVGEYRKTNRGGKGVINIKTSERNGEVVAIREVVDTDEIILATKGGVVIRMNVSGIRETGRNAQGVRLIRLDENDSVSDVTILSQKAQEEGGE
ncbi:TPA: DNA gyrase subunit A [bacterium]|nr:MAG: DNA gyrase subunit A [Candidatus Hydrogenedentes bacterium CG1_02_42_14]PIU47925.1 MAG: DNA gyrase subunit A [Candidatus Hydrogenedentes bacterium CG07_land_8_20_14_0_80_42_17]HBW47658.1 DNA gyrase subunit A [bacterium]